MYHFKSTEIRLNGEKVILVPKSLPDNPELGNFCLDSSDGKLKYYTGTKWITVQSIKIQKDDANDIEDIYILNFEGNVIVTDEENGKVTILFGNAPPTPDYRGYYNQSSGLSSTTSTNWQQKLRLTFTPEIAGDYEIHWSAVVSHADTGVFLRMRIQIDDSTTYNEWAQELYNFKYSDGALAIKSGVFVVSLSQSSHNIDMDFRSGESGKTMYIKEAWLIARRIT